MITYLDAPLRGTNTIDGHDILVVALVAGPVTNDHPRISAVYIDQDGSMSQVPMSEVNVNWRFDDRKHRWVDVDTGEDLEQDDDDGS